MKKLLPVLLFLVISLVSCRMNLGRTVKGNGRMSTEERTFTDLSRLKIRGSINVELVPGPSALKVEADENLLRYIETREENGWLVIKTRDHVRLRSSHPIRVFVSTNMLTAVNIAGSGYVKGQGKFSGAGGLDVDVSGSGDVALAVNTPRITVDIAGSGSVALTGETREATIDIAGSGSYQAQDLMTESTDIDITGSGDARVYAADRLNADVLGSGTVYYRGNADVRSHTTGSGRVKRMQ